MDYINLIKKAINESIEIRNSLSELDFEQLLKVSREISSSIANGKKLMVCGNGGSAADAQHLVAEFLIRYRPTHNRISLPAISLAGDTSTLTACANDYGFEKIFSRTISSIGQEGDVLVAISTSGNSTNILEALTEAKRKKIYTIGLLGRTGGLSKQHCDTSICVESDSIARIQELHITFCHIIVELVEEQLILSDYLRLQHG